MKIKTYKSISWFGPYHLLWFLPHKTRVNAARRLWLRPFELLNCLRDKKPKIHIDYWDTWNMDHTLSLIINPLMKQYREQNIDCPSLDQEDFPEFTISKEEPYNHAAWLYLVDEIIWATGEIIEDDDYGLSFEEMIAKDKRIEEAMTLFGKYFRSFWD